MNRIYFRLNWREYFKLSGEQLKKHIKGNGVVLYRKLYKEVVSAATKKKSEHFIALDENTRTILSIPNEDYVEVLNECQKFLEAAEDYESCASIRDTITKLKTPSKRTRRKKEVEKLILVTKK